MCWGLARSGTRSVVKSAEYRFLFFFPHPRSFVSHSAGVTTTRKISEKNSPQTCIVYTHAICIINETWRIFSTIKSVPWAVQRVNRLAIYSISRFRYHVTVLTITRHDPARMNKVRCIHSNFRSVFLKIPASIDRDNWWTHLCLFVLFWSFCFGVQQLN